ncbi:hypothetical protein CONPUDRAFT_77774 [Coniophora puteana RWD-64-598 SS2]|uniref:Uncharacterized protein n=1 Tax=Coniophora puteana (strain RWD-64-598) TaxID=741705 RepID=A0A5M3M6K2_CONPW|nr:uncharacterized protein CONPUDRAFT_77774 [Coniophora puteana RWD-64-598 SS2]EIW74992.1 hypothetical protein CONPUDRAFT_77774 [Coniophora puteana RWD-64-598 SS2]
MYNAYFTNALYAVGIVTSSFMDELSLSSQECMYQNNSSPFSTIYSLFDYPRLISKVTASSEVQVVVFVIQLWLGDGFMIVPIVGIAFSLIVIRMGLGITTEMHLREQDNKGTITRGSRHDPAATNAIMLLAQGSSTNTEAPEALYNSSSPIVSVSKLATIISEDTDLHLAPSHGAEKEVKYRIVKRGDCEQKKQRKAEIVVPESMSDRVQAKRPAEGTSMMGDVAATKTEPERKRMQATGKKRSRTNEVSMDVRHGGFWCRKIYSQGEK